MLLSEFRSRLQDSVLDLAWNCWGSIGLSSSGSSRWPQPIDPEALILLTLTASRTDVRLFEEMAGWMLLNERLVSFRRLRSLSDGRTDERLVAGLTGWMRVHGSKSQRHVRPRPEGHDEFREPEDLFRNDRLQVRNPDPSFLRAGFLTEEFKPSQLARRPNVRAPSALAFRLRLTLGIGIRSELVRVMLDDSQSRNVRELAASVGYSKRNVLDSLAELEEAGLVSGEGDKHELRYRIRPEPWRRLLELGASEPDSQFEWSAVSSGLRAILEWSWTEAARTDDEYLLASSASRLIGESPALAKLVATGDLPLPGDTSYWTRFSHRILLRVDELTNQ